MEEEVLRDERTNKRPLPLSLERFVHANHVQSLTNKKAFQSNANRPLADSPRFTVNTFEHVLRGVGACTVRSKLNKFGRGCGAGPCAERSGWGLRPCTGEGGQDHIQVPPVKAD